MALATAPLAFALHDTLIAALKAEPLNSNAQPALESEIPPPPASEIRLRAPNAKGREDAALVKAVLEGDAAAFRAIWNKYIALVRSKLGHLHRDIDDCVQEVFVRLHARLPYLRDPTALSSFIIGITLRVAGTELRRRKSASWILLTPTGDLPEPASGPKEDATAREAYARFEAILGRLGPRARRVFELRYVEHKELVDVAREMNVSLATAKRHLARVSACVNVMARNDPLLVDYVRKVDEHDARDEAQPGCQCFECVLAGANP